MDCDVCPVCLDLFSEVTMVRELACGHRLCDRCHANQRQFALTHVMRTHTPYYICPYRCEQTAVTQASEADDDTACTLRRCVCKAVAFSSCLTCVGGFFVLVDKWMTQDRAHGSFLR